MMLLAVTAKVLLTQVDEAAAEAFDRQFPPLEKRSGTPSQERFLELVSMQRPAD